MPGLVNMQYFLEKMKFLKYLDGDGIYQGPTRWEGSLRLVSVDSLKSLGTLEEVCGRLDLVNCLNLECLGNLRTISELANNSNHGTSAFPSTLNRSFSPFLEIRGCRKLKNLGKLEMVCGWCTLDGCTNLECLGNLRIITKPLCRYAQELYSTLQIRFCPNLKSLGKLECVEGTLFLSESNVVDLGALRHVGKDLELSKDHIDYGHLLRVEGSIVTGGNVIRYPPNTVYFTDIVVHQRSPATRAHHNLYVLTHKDHLRLLKKIADAELTELPLLKMDVGGQYSFYIDQRIKGLRKRNL